jgi:hypothetical protein
MDLVRKTGLSGGGDDGREGKGLACDRDDRIGVPLSNGPLARVSRAAGGSAENDGLHWPRRDGLKWPHLASVVVGVDVD